jgi:hypothetical protein
MVAAKGNGKLTNVTDGRHEFAARHTDNDDVCSSGSFVYSSSSTVTGATDGGTHDVLKARALQLWLPGVLTDLDIWNAMQASTPCRRQCRAWCGQGGGATILPVKNCCDISGCRDGHDGGARPTKSANALLVLLPAPLRKKRSFGVPCPCCPLSSTPWPQSRSTQATAFFKFRCGERAARRQAAGARQSHCNPSPWCE